MSDMLWGLEGRVAKRGEEAGILKHSRLRVGSRVLARYLQTTELVLVSREWLMASAGGHETLSLSV